ncbi:ankyrin repeat-containing domain protein [Chytridium lagenaria]|nr:ankyrin repeat-containing domain protein [Chytridium lagenaria]
MLNPVRRAEAQYLRDAIASGNLYLCKKIISKKKLPIQSPNPENGWPLLFYAIRYNQNEIVEYLLDNGHETEQCSKDFDGTTALMVAAEFKNDQAFQMYIERHPQTVQWENKTGRVRFIIATEKAMNAAIVTLLDMGADVNCLDGDGSTPLHHPTIKNKRGWIPADYAYSIEMLEHFNGNDFNFVAVAENRPIRPPPPLGTMRSLISISGPSQPNIQAPKLDLRTFF